MSPFETRWRIEILFRDGSAGYFCGWDRGEPDLSSNREDAASYDLMFHREECMDDYERLCNLGFDASIETNGFVRAARLESFFADQFAHAAE